MNQITYRYELQPTSEQSRKFGIFSGQCRFVYNELLARSKAAFNQGEKQSLTAFGLSYEVTKLKSELEWLSECHIHCLQEAAANLAKAYKRWFTYLKTRKGIKSGPPKFKSKKTARPSFTYKSGIKVNGSKVWLPKVGWVKFRKTREPVGIFKTANVSQSASGKWFVCISSQTVIPKLPERTEVVGMDVGLTTFATLSTGEKIVSPRWFKRSERKLARLQQSLARKKPGSANRSKARVKVARHHERVASQRRDFQHKLSTRLIRENQAIGVESLCISGLMRTRLSKSFADKGLGEFLRQLTYKAEWYGRSLVAADRFFPSSKTCSKCGEVNQAVALGVTEWECPCCGNGHDRDINAAVNLEKVAAGHAEKLNACGASTRPSLGSAVCDEAGIPRL